MHLLWTKQLSVGNEILDAEHKKLIGLTNSIEYAIKARDGFALLQIFKQIMDCAHDHFANEERFAQAVNFSFEQHRLDHQHLQQELHNTWNELYIKRGMWWSEYVMDYYPEFLRKWLIEHITNEDMLMKPALQAYPYDFRPGCESGIQFALHQDNSCLQKAV